MKQTALLLPLPLLLAACLARAAGWPPVVQSASGWVLKPSASWQYDHVSADAGQHLDHHGFRRQRTALSLSSPGGHELKLDYDFAAGVWADVLVRLRIGSLGDLRIGQIKQPISLENLTSHRTLAHLERSPAVALVPGRRLGLEWRRSNDLSSFSVAVSGSDLDQLVHSRAALARFTRAWNLPGETHRLHLGLAGGREWPRSPVRLRVSPGVARLPISWLSTAPVPETDTLDRLASELAWDLGPLHLQGEWIRLRGSGANGRLRAHGHYLALGWRPGGEARVYKQGVFDRLVPTRPWGALELVARYGRADLEAPADPRRYGRTFTVGVNWYIDRNWRLQTQFGHARGSSGVTDLNQIHGIRLHYQF